MSALTLCLIARDEAAFLGACLDSVAGLVDSIVVVDTGSADATAAIAASKGAVVVAHAWTDDFAAARNAALAHVPRGKGRYVLVLDADERLAPGAADALRRAVARADFDLGLLPLHDATSLDAQHADVVSGRARRGEPVLLPRVFRFDETLRWEGRVHEQPTAWARRPGRRSATIDAAIVHLGGVPELRAARGKSDRNRRLLELRAQDEPDNAIVRAYLAREHDRAGDAQRALDEARASWAALVAPAANGAPACDSVLPATVLAYYAIQAGRLDEAELALARARGWTKPHPNIELLSGLAHERRALAADDEATFADEIAAAAADYARCLALHGRTFASEVLPGACGATGTTRLATAKLLLGDPRAAKALFESVLRDDSTSLEARLGRAECALDDGAAADALRELEPLLGGGTPDAWLLAAASAAAFGDASTAWLFCGSARAAARTKPWIGAWRRARLDALERALGAPAAPADVAPAPTASVVIPCFNRFDLLEPALAAFARERAATGCQIVLVDDGSEPPLAPFVESLGLSASFEIVRRANGGRGAALNDGLARATGEIVVFCDSDIVPQPGFVADHVAFHRARGSELATHLGALEWGVDAGLFGALLGARSNPRLRGGERDVDWTQWFTDNWSFRRSLLASRGLAFDLAYRAWGFEELDLARTLKQLGATNSLTKSARGLHLKPATPEGLRASFVRSVPNLLHLARKHPNDADVRGWLSARCDAESVARAERAYEHAWNRLVELDAAHPGALRDVTSGPLAKLAVALSDATFHLGIARGLVQHADLAAQNGDLLPRAHPSKLHGQVEQLALRLDALERRLDAGSSSPWLAAVAAELGWDADAHPLRARWAAARIAG